MGLKEKRELARVGLKVMAEKVLSRIAAGDDIEEIVDGAFGESCDMLTLFEGPIEEFPGPEGTGYRRDMVRIRRWVAAGASGPVLKPGRRDDGPGLSSDYRVPF